MIEQANDFKIGHLWWRNICSRVQTTNDVSDGGGGVKYVEGCRMVKGAALYQKGLRFHAIIPLQSSL